MLSPQCKMAIEGRLYAHIKEILDTNAASSGLSKTSLTSVGPVSTIETLKDHKTTENEKKRARILLAARNVLIMEIETYNHQNQSLSTTLNCKSAGTSVVRRQDRVCKITAVILTMKTKTMFILVKIGKQ